ncbi:unnamed protein product [Amoebophrya sp. A25]|nr:unnamed protein product [Amoebophrya sp. A25]|eukprot:GSA25T00012930001.1
MTQADIDPELENLDRYTKSFAKLQEVVLGKATPEMIQSVGMEMGLGPNSLLSPRDSEVPPYYDRKYLFFAKFQPFLRHRRRVARRMMELNKINREAAEFSAMERLERAQNDLREQHMGRLGEKNANLRREIKMRKIEALRKEKKALVDEQREISKKIRKIRRRRSELTTAVAARSETIRPKKMQPLGMNSAGRGELIAAALAGKEVGTKDEKNIYRPGFSDAKHVADVVWTISGSATTSFTTKPLAEDGDNAEVLSEVSRMRRDFIGVCAKACLDLNGSDEFLKQAAGSRVEDGKAVQEANLKPQRERREKLRVIP